MGDEEDVFGGKQPVRQSGLTGTQALTLGFQVPWPASIIISKKAISKYSLIFRHLFSIRTVCFHKNAKYLQNVCFQVELVLSQTWLEHQHLKELDLEASVRPSYILRQQMLHFIRTLRFYLSGEVIEPNWHNLERQMNEVYISGVKFPFLPFFRRRQLMMCWTPMFTFWISV